MIAPEPHPNYDAVNDAHVWPDEATMKALRAVPKYKAIDRLKREGREDAFRKRQAHIRRNDHKTRDEAFYLALLEFQPLE